MDVHKNKKASETAPWYAGGLRFGCTQCGACCTGEPGYVWVGSEEIDALARALAMAVETFAARYLRLVRGRVSLREKANGDCVFFARPKKLCRVYAARPTQCRTFPFWPEIVRSSEAWEEEAAFCPGIGLGKRWPAATVEGLETTSRTSARRIARALPEARARDAEPEPA